MGIHVLPVTTRPGPVSGCRLVDSGATGNAALPVDAAGAAREVRVHAGDIVITRQRHTAVPKERLADQLATDSCK